MHMHGNIGSPRAGRKVLVGKGEGKGRYIYTMFRDMKNANAQPVCHARHAQVSHNVTHAMLLPVQPTPWERMQRRLQVPRAKR